MRKIYCDRCNKLIKIPIDAFDPDREFEPYLVDIRKRITNIDHPEVFCYSNYYDLCTKCRKELCDVIDAYLDVKKK